MQLRIGASSIELVPGDISEQQVDAIVNAANGRLSGGGGVDGVIQRKGGPTIMQETDQRYPGGCQTGSAVISRAGNLPAKYVIHAVGPIWSGGNLGEDGLLASAFRSAMELAAEHGCESVAFPAISTGAYRFPLDEAADIALEAVAGFLRKYDQPMLVRFVLQDGPALAAFTNALEQLTE